MEDNLIYYFKLVNNFMAFFFKTFMHTNFLLYFLYYDEGIISNRFQGPTAIFRENERGYRKIDCEA